jgi:uncharacterized membrane protein
VSEESFHFESDRPGFWARLRAYLLGGLLVIGPSALSIWVLWRGFIWLDGLIGQYLRFPWLEYRRIPGLGLIAILLLLVIAGWLASLFAGATLARAGERALARVPLFRTIYKPAKQLGEAFLTERRTVFQQVVLVQWPHPGMWAIGFVTTPPPRLLSEAVGTELLSVFMPGTPNPATGRFQLVPRDATVPVDLTVEQGMRMIVSGGVVNPTDAEIARRGVE